MSENLSEIKAFARKAALAARKVAHARGQSEAACLRLSEALEPFAGQPIAGYLPLRSEIDPLPAMARHFGPVGVPVVLGPARPLIFRRWTPETPLIPGDFQTLIPAEGEEIFPRVLIVPLVAFDARGYRLGYGGGFYDRTLEGLRARGPVTAIGFAFAAQELEEVPVEPTDQPLDRIITEAGEIRLTP